MISTRGITRGSGDPMGKTAFLAPFLAVLTLGAAPVGASGLVDGSDPRIILEIARELGPAELGVDNVGDPQVTGAVENIPYAIFFYGCQSGRDCTNIQFTAGWITDDFDIGRINSWNREYRFARAWLDDEQDPIVAMDVNLEFGVTRENFEDTFLVWASILTSFAGLVER
jgi:hypothetical protein